MTIRGLECGSRINITILHIFSSIFSSCSHIITSSNAHAALNPLNTTLKRIILPENYIKEVRPPSVKGTPVLVELSVFVIDINSINVEDMDFRLDMFVHQTWSDSRLTLSEDLFEEGDDFVTLPPEFFEYLWHPHPIFMNSKVSGECCDRIVQLYFFIVI